MDEGAFWGASWAGLGVFSALYCFGGRDPSPLHRETMADGGASREISRPRKHAL
jgi:hypothetical protein